MSSKKNQGTTYTLLLPVSQLEIDSFKTRPLSNLPQAQQAPTEGNLYTDE
jgi:hypothetical protein